MSLMLKREGKRLSEKMVENIKKNHGETEKLIENFKKFQGDKESSKKSDGGVEINNLGSPLKNIGFSDLSLAFQKKNFTGSPPNSGIYGNSLTEIQKTSNILNSDMKKTLLKSEETIQTMQKGSETIFFYIFEVFFV